MDAIPWPSQSLDQEIETGSRRILLEKVPNHRLLKGEEYLIDFHEKLSQCLSWVHETFQCTAKTDRDQKSSTEEKMICHGRSGISGDI